MRISKNNQNTKTEMANQVNNNMKKNMYTKIIFNKVKML